MTFHTTTLVCLTLSFVGCNNTTNLNPICGNFHNRCYGVWNDYFKDPLLLNEAYAERMRRLAENDLVGICQLGTPVCDSDDNIINCIGAVYPERKDICNGLDDDCNGKTDEDFYPNKATDWWIMDQPLPCKSTKGVCANANITCTDGIFKCHYPPNYRPNKETAADCDGFDNDCNGLIDDITMACTDMLGNPISCACYEGPINTERHGSCHPGYYKCSAGRIKCIGQSLPQEEICDEIDNDCNSIIDDTAALLTNIYDILFVMDTSGSMCPWIDATAAALITYAEQFRNNANFRFAVTIVTNSPDLAGTSYVSRKVGFTSLDNVISFLENVGCRGTGFEATLDGMLLACDTADPLELAWRDDTNRLVFLFTDEQPQTYLNPDTTKQDVIDICLDTETIMFIWYGDAGWSNPTDFIEIADATGGQSFQLKLGVSPEEEWKPIFDNLNDVIMSICE